MKRKKEIKDAALKLFLSKGMNNTTMEEISKDISIARSTIYDYYSSKEEILYDLLDGIIDEEMSYNKNQSYCKQLIDITKQVFLRLKTNFLLYKLLFKELPALKTETKVKLQKWQELSLKQARVVFEKAKKEDIFSKDLSIESLVFYYQALVGQKMSFFLFNETEFDIEQEAKEVIGVLFYGIKGRDNE